MVAATRKRRPSKSLNMCFPRWLFSSFPMFLPDSSSHIFFAVFRWDQIPTGSSEEWRQGAFTWAQDTPFYLWLWDHFSTNQAEWKVCAKYTHGGAVKGVVKSNFRFVFRRGRRRKTLSNRNKILFPSSQYSQGWRRPPVLKSITAETNVTAAE